MSSSQKIEKNLFIIFYLNAIYPLSPSLKSFLVDKIKSCSFKKNEIISREGEICDKLYLIKKGLVRGYFVSEGIDITTWIDTENEIFTSITGFFKHEKTREYIQAMEDTHCDYLEYEDYKYSLNNFPEIRQIYRIMLEQYYVLAEHRVYLARIPNAGKRLEFFLEHCKPEIVERIPRKHLASFLAMRPETLSRLMKEKF
ncbi:Crp/Fnr family transcriptional regulator [Muricauda sp. CAU 1633]|uniref:Crp/Fnr family transcriptional regulator n=1 Tax=Allomuricauda sp. CAU 1633 TaxID=2816036 RepID=UPI001A8D9715|nr:Crp/Fnr family transcriptional regulator [Muricauda sp. CAU 1633]MBO0321902.1 Crp/Fnr family transcriptional regulator [Muricauda sp. CAU 1633]